MDILIAKKIKKKYSENHEVLKGVSLRIKSGEIVGLIGESGSGKSTLVRCLLMIEKIDDGEIFFLNKPLHRMNKKSLRHMRPYMQVVLQNPSTSLNPKLKIIDSLMEILDAHPHLEPVHIKDVRDRRETCAKRLLEMVGLPDRFLSCYPHELSGGQKQRVAIARAISIAPPLIILDEPTSSLDVYSQHQILILLKELHNELGLSYLFISHDLPTVYTLSNKIIVLKEGKVIDEFCKEELFSSQRHDDVKQFISLYEEG
ncbi:ABC transporter ATP-binding protein [Anoxybacillus ayderensis]|uniref:ABC transporter ATP-binding protein n=1 Tax=Anoxybacillus sp. ST70 TaxID=2864180 RepID=UPI00031B66E7|nr:dipeptide/oligopeptide/nickel ABC transporter ATP-binding protein [Anoxybacillus sp. ST70]AXM90176.1 ABC transporter ATP-binding protein [Anoxybacillus ayderensis G10]MBW9218888.1 dipeptide/oligopeptide/nickel ABC transporter ATP-binding protein [Anoxybacillus sp. ST70]THD17640.1 ABC transporter ATP-binding protein [Anoxybacillus ayderensis]